MLQSTLKLNPHIIARRFFATFFARIQHASRFNQQEFDFSLRIRFVLHTFRYDKHLACV